MMKRLLPYLFSLVLAFGLLGIMQVRIEEIPTTSIVRLVDVIPTAKAGTVHIQAPNWQGSGFVVTENIITTARHVVEDALQEGDVFIITLNNGIEVESDLTIIMEDYDVAFIWVEDANIVPLELGSIADCVVGQQIFIVGSPYGFDNFNAVSTGIISGLNRDWDDYNPYTGENYGWEIVFTSDSSASPGNSGGPLFTMDGKVRGILVGGYNSTVNCLIPVDIFIEDLEDIEKMFRYYNLEGYEWEEVSEGYYESY